MGNYLNQDGKKFYEITHSDIYVDKTELLTYTNSVLQTLQKYICISRPRRFGKSITASMIAAYYSRGCDAKELFSPYKIARNLDFDTYRNKYNTLFLNMQEFLSRTKNIYELLDRMKRLVLRDLKREYPNVDYFDDTDLIESMQDVYQETNCPFVVIIDEWDCIFREYKQDKEAQEIYLDFLRDMLKDKSCIALAYMTGILPIKKYGTHSALNMFDEFSMINPGPLASYVGFTELEVAALCTDYHMDLDEIKAWYNGYSFEKIPSIYNPRSVVSCMRFGKIGNYWNQTETFEALQIYIDMNFEGLKDDVLSMIAGESVPVNTGSFTVSDWGEISKALKNSADTLQAIWQGRPEQVALGIQQAHFETSHIQYNDENALSYTVSLALYAARNFYTIHREFAGGKGFADMVFLPRKKFPDKPALVIELKWDHSAQGAITQIKQKQYCESLKEYHGNLLLVGINYDTKSRIHTCKIEPFSL